MEDGSGTDTGVEGAGTAGIEGAGPRRDEHFFGWFPLGPQPLVLLAPGILPLSGTASARLPDSPTIVTPSTIEPTRPIRVFILLPHFEFEH
jgi:hypothetical protein